MMEQIYVYDLSCEYKVNPLGIDVKKPRLSWKLHSEYRSVFQVAYQVQVSLDSNFEEILWDTTRIDSEQSLHIIYEGPTLQSETRYFYRIRSWDNLNNETSWSSTAWFETAFMNQSDWKANWITADIDNLSKEAFLFRKDFSVKSNIKSARIYATSAGVYELQLNGERVGEDLLSPGWTSYHHRIQYQTYDITSLLQENRNTVGMIVADGWYKGYLSWGERRHHYGDTRSILAQIHITYEDGSKDIISTDSSWKSSTSPILFSELYHGEIYDARLEKTGWSTPEYIDSDWNNTIIQEFNFSKLIAQENDPVRVTEILKPINVITTSKGDTLIDMGQNMVGRMKFTISAPAGTKITLTHAEVIDKDGEIYFGNLRLARQRIEYITKGDSEEESTSYFTFQGFRYVKVEGLPNNDKDFIMKNFVGEVIHSDMRRTGTFETSNEKVNKLYENIIWGQRGNFVDVPSDCPQRDALLGWTGDAQVFLRTAFYNFNGGPFFTKWLRDLKADQFPNGGVPFVIPDVAEGDSSAAWGDAAVICPWIMYTQYDDIQILVEQYDSMKAWIEYMRVQSKNEFVFGDTGFHFGDWLALDSKEGTYFGATPDSFIGTAFYAYSTSLLVKTASLLNYHDDVIEYTNLYKGIKTYFNDEFISKNGRLTAPTQTAHVLALTFDLVDGIVRERVARDLNNLILDNDYHLTTGFVGTPYLNFALSNNGYHETAVRLLLQETYPSWLYAINKGATTIWEHWDGIKEDGTFWHDDMNSYNHYAYGAIGEWMYRMVAGLDFDDSATAFKRIKIHPHITGNEFDYVKTTYESMYGKISSSWQLTGKNIEINIEIPANASATVILPNASLASVTESNLHLELVEGVQSFIQDGENVVLTVGSGKYSFTYKNTKSFIKEFTSETKLVDVLTDSHAVEILEKYIPGISKKHSLYAKLRTEPINTLQSFAFSMLSDEVFTSLLNELNKK